MTDALPENPWRPAAAVAAFMLAGIGALSTGLFVAAFGFRAEAFADPALAVAGGPEAALLLQRAAITDLFSYYLPLAPIALALRVAIRPGTRPSSTPQRSPPSATCWPARSV